VYAGGTVTLGDATRNADLLGAPERGPGMPAVSEGLAPSTPDEVAASSTLGRGIGDDVEIASRRLRIVGIVENSTALANLPNVSHQPPPSSDGDRPGPAATTRWPLLNKQHSAYPRTDQTHLDVADPAENNQSPS
jgi:hypothetical protein